MAKLNVFALPRPQRPTQTVTFETPQGPISLTLRAPDVADMARAAEAAARLVEDFITGSEVRAAAEFPDEIPVSESLFQSVALVAAMQTATEPSERYTEIEWVMIATRLPAAWAEVQRVAQELMTRWRQDRGNSPAAPTEPSAV
jgi:hypothetical protein